MRTTLTLEQDVADRLERLARNRRVSLEVLAIAAIRAGLAALEEQAGPRAPFRTSGLDLGASRVGNLDDVAGVLARDDGGPCR